MSRTLAVTALVTPLLLLLGCSTVRPPERFPDLGAEDMPRQSLGMVREGDHCYVSSVDGNYITQYDVNAIAISTYRQHLIPPGRHTLAIFYRQQRNFETLASGPRYVTVDIPAGASYELRSNVNGPDVPYTERLRTANWRPAVVDARTNATVAISKINEW